ncbi:unnamed protein product [Sphenostylis stenocarpa]|uniref:Uncharacterized protein n=1 Tax=Sphenostylis stenocarpa TaxID=92480 RepID=A0AA86VYG3_9FABA|nr:unnamed protein product [Sphenostylis stenocarpa]
MQRNAEKETYKESRGRMKKRRDISRSGRGRCLLFHEPDSSGEHKTLPSSLPDDDT